MRAEELKRYGKSISDMPSEAFAVQGAIIFRLFQKKLGTFGLMVFALRAAMETQQLSVR